MSQIPQNILYLHATLHTYIYHNNTVQVTTSQNKITLIDNNKMGNLNRYQGMLNLCSQAVHFNSGIPVSEE